VGELGDIPGATSDLGGGESQAGAGIGVSGRNPDDASADPEKVVRNLKLAELKSQGDPVEDAHLTMTPLLSG